MDALSSNPARAATERPSPGRFDAGSDPAASPPATGAELVARHTTGRRIDFEGLAADLRQEIRQRPTEATRLTMQVLEQVPADDRDELAQAFIEAHSDAELRDLGGSDAGRGALALAVNELAKGSVYRDEAVQVRRVGTALGTPIDVSVNAGWSWERVSGAVHTVLDVAGFIPGLGAIPDLINAGLYAVEGDMQNAALSGVAAVPLFGDGAKGATMAARAGREVLQAGARQGDEALGAGSVLLRQGDEALGAARRGTDTPGSASIEVTLRGRPVTLEGIEMRSVDYMRRDRASYDALRNTFDRGVRSDFLKSLAGNPEHVAALRRAGLDDAAIGQLAQGRVPQGWQVHHKLPLDDGGTNAFDNLVLIRNDPYHLALNNAQRQLVRGLEVGQSARMDWPVIPGVVYPPQ